MRQYLRGRMMHCRNTGGPRFGLEYLQDGILILDGGRIIDLLPAEQALAQGVPAERCRQLGGQLLVPGFIDTHVHAYQLDIIGSYGEQLLEWLERYTFPGEMRMADAKLAMEVAELFFRQLLRNGTTTALVFSTMHKAATEVLFNAAERLGLCMITGKVLMDRNAPAALLDDPASAFRDSAELIEKWHRHERLYYAVTPRFSITSTPEQLAAAGRLLSVYPDVYVQTHLAENKAEVAYVKELFPESDNYLDTYDRHGLCTERSVFAHSVHLEDAEVARLRVTHSSVSCCPTSNLFLGSGLFDWGRMRAEGVSLSLGTDVGGGTSYSMLETLRELYKVTQLRSTRFSPLEGFYTITLGNARALKLESRLGNLAAGSDADFVILDPDADELIGRRVAAARDIEEEWFVYMTLGDERVISETWAGGRCLHRNEAASTAGAAA